MCYPISPQCTPAELGMASTRVLKWKMAEWGVMDDFHSYVTSTLRFILHCLLHRCELRQHCLYPAVALGRRLLNTTWGLIQVAAMFWNPNAFWKRSAGKDHNWESKFLKPVGNFLLLWGCLSIAPALPLHLILSSESKDGLIPNIMHG